MGESRKKALRSNCQELWIRSGVSCLGRCHDVAFLQVKEAVGSGSQAARDLGVARSVVEGAIALAPVRPSLRSEPGSADPHGEDPRPRGIEGRLSIPQDCTRFR